MVNIDCSFLHINIVPSDAYCLTDSASSSKQKYKKRIPMEEKRILRNIINKFSLLLYCQCSSALSSTTISFFHLGISSIYRISSYLLANPSIFFISSFDFLAVINFADCTESTNNFNSASSNCLLPI